MKLKYSKIVGDDIPISETLFSLSPLVVDRSGFYRYNQETSSDLIDTVVQLDTNSAKYIADPALLADNIIVSRRLDAWGKPLFYQYQPKFDCKYPENVRVYDTNGKLISPIIEYGYYDSGSTPAKLADNTQVFYDSLDGYTLYGEPVGAVTYNVLSTTPDLPFTVYGSCLSTGRIEYASSTFLNGGPRRFSVYINPKAVTGTGDYELVGSDLGGSTSSRIYIRLTGGNPYLVFFTHTLELDPTAWYRLDYEELPWNQWSNLYVTNLTTMVTTSFNGYMKMYLDSVELIPEQFFLDATYASIFDFAMYEYATGADQFPAYDRPLYALRYSKSITWLSTKPSDTAYRIRFLFHTDDPASIIYDAIDNTGAMFRNRKEEVNHHLIYKKYANFASNDWTWDTNLKRVMIIDSLAADTDVGDHVYVKMLPENRIRVYYDTIDRKVHVTSGMFTADNYDGVTNQDYYYIPEYEKMPVASDNQVAFRPYYVKVLKERANLISPNKIQISPFYIYDGEYPSYIVPHMYEDVLSYNQAGTIVRTSIVTLLNYVTSRGINIYINGTLLDNSEIIDYDTYNGTIQLQSSISSDDYIEVTYLKKMADFVLPYPILDSAVSEADGGIGTKNAFRVYLRPHYPNYVPQNPYDTQEEKLCYKFLENGKEVTGEKYKSCLTNNQFNENTITKHSDRIISLADVSCVSSITYNDIRERGGGLKDENSRLVSGWETYLDSGYGVDGKRIPWSILLVKMPKSTLTAITDTYYPNNPTEALTYIKTSIERHMKSGAFYVLIDEDNHLFDDPYPLNVTRK